MCSKCGAVDRGLNFCSSCGHATKGPTKNQSKPVNWIAISLAALAIMVVTIGLFYFFALHDNQSTLDARIMSVFRVDGDAISLQSAAGVRTDARGGMGLHAGYTVSTGLNSFCYISLDADSIVKMDTTTDISIAQLTDRLLRINVNRGQVLVDLRWQAPEHELEAIIGNTVITVRGTLFIAGAMPGGEATVIVLDGSVYVNDVQLDAGYTMRMYDGAVMDYEILPTEFGELDSFQLNAIINHRQRLISSGAMDFYDLEEVARLIGGYGVEEEDYEPEELIAEAMPTPTPEPAPTPTPEPSPTPTPTPSPTPTPTPGPTPTPTPTPTPDLPETEPDETDTMDTASWSWADAWFDISGGICFHAFDNANLYLRPFRPQYERGDIITEVQRGHIVWNTGSGGFYTCFQNPSPWLINVSYIDYVGRRWVGYMLSTFLMYTQCR